MRVSKRCTGCVQLPRGALSARAPGCRRPQDRSAEFGDSRRHSQLAMPSRGAALDASRAQTGPSPLGNWARLDRSASPDGPARVARFPEGSSLQQPVLETG